MICDLKNGTSITLKELDEGSLVVLWEKGLLKGTNLVRKSMRKFKMSHYILYIYYPTSLEKNRKKGDIGINTL